MFLYVTISKDVSDGVLCTSNDYICDHFVKCRLPKDGLKLSIVDSKPLALANAVSEKDDFFVHTPRKTIAEVLESRQVLISKTI